MMPLLSSPEEEYLVHIGLVESRLASIFPVFEPVLIRVLGWDNSDGSLNEAFRKMASLHDLGKLTRKWQGRISPFRPPLPKHASIGAAYLWKMLPPGLKEPICFAVAIHHTDRGLLGDNIERPDVQAITDGITKHNGELHWAEGVGELGGKYFPQDARNLSVHDLKEMERGLRLWAKGDSILNQHKKRLRATLAHHVLKLCDISAAKERSELKREDDKDYYGGWLMGKMIADYVETIGKRME